MKEISVIVPVYNVEKYLKKCLLSIKAQTFESYEVILVEDGSTDNSKNIVQEFVSCNSEKFKLFLQENKGLSGARNTGMQYASGKYICFIDSDDTVEPDFLAKLYQKTIDTDADMVFCAFRSVDEQGNCIQNIYESVVEPNEITNIKSKKELFLIQNAAWNKLYKRQIIEENNLSFTEGVWYEDIRFTKKYLLFAEKCVYCDDILYNYLQRSGSIMSSMKSERNIEILDALKEVEDFYAEYNLWEDFKDEIEILAIEHIYISALVRLIRAKERKQMLVIRGKFLELYPDYKDNKYLKTLDKKRLVVYMLLNLKCYKLIEILFGLKGDKNV